MSHCVQREGALLAVLDAAAAAAVAAVCLTEWVPCCQEGPQVMQQRFVLQGINNNTVQHSNDQNGVPLPLLTPSSSSSSGEKTHVCDCLEPQVEVTQRLPCSRWCCPYYPSYSSK